MDSEPRKTTTTEDPGNDTNLGLAIGIPVAVGLVLVAGLVLMFIIIAKRRRAAKKNASRDRGNLPPESGVGSNCQTVAPVATNNLNCNDDTAKHQDGTHVPGQGHLIRIIDVFPNNKSDANLNANNFFLNGDVTIVLHPDQTKPEVATGNGAYENQGHCKTSNEKLLKVICPPDNMVKQPCLNADPVDHVIKGDPRLNVNFQSEKVFDVDHVYDDRYLGGAFDDDDRPPIYDEVTMSPQMKTKEMPAAQLPVTSYVALYHFTPQDDTQLPLSPNEVIVGTGKTDSEWIEGYKETCPGKVGWFPKSYVRDGVHKSDLIPGIKENSLEEDDEFDDVTGFECRALYPYDAIQAGDLSFVTGDVIAVIEKLENGWWRGLHGDEHGWFPGSYVEPIYNSPPVRFNGDKHSQFASAVDITGEYMDFQPDPQSFGSTPDIVLAENSSSRRSAHLDLIECNPTATETSEQERNKKDGKLPPDVGRTNVVVYQNQIPKKEVRRRFSGLPKLVKFPKASIKMFMKRSGEFEVTRPSPPKPPTESQQLQQLKDLKRVVPQPPKSSSSDASFMNSLKRRISKSFFHESQPGTNTPSENVPKSNQSLDKLWITPTGEPAQIIHSINVFADAEHEESKHDDVFEPETDQNKPGSNSSKIQNQQNGTIITMATKRNSSSGHGSRSSSQPTDEHPFAGQPAQTDLASRVRFYAGSYSDLPSRIAMTSANDRISKDDSMLSSSEQCPRDMLAVLNKFDDILLEQDSEHDQSSVRSSQIFENDVGRSGIDTILSAPDGFDGAPGDSLPMPPDDAFPVPPDDTLPVPPDDFLSVTPDNCGTTIFKSVTSDFSNSRTSADKTKLESSVINKSSLKSGKTVELPSRNLPVDNRVDDPDQGRRAVLSNGGEGLYENSYFKATRAMFESRDSGHNPPQGMNFEYSQEMEDRMSKLGRSREEANRLSAHKSPDTNSKSSKPRVEKEKDVIGNSVDETGGIVEVGLDDGELDLQKLLSCYRTPSRKNGQQAKVSMHSSVEKNRSTSGVESQDVVQFQHLSTMESSTDPDPRGIGEYEDVEYLSPPESFCDQTESARSTRSLASSFPSPPLPPPPAFDLATDPLVFVHPDGKSVSQHSNESSPPPPPMNGIHFDDFDEEVVGEESII